MEYEWDEAKAAANRQKHGIAFERIEKFDWTTSLVVRDERFDYGEKRWLAIGKLGNRVFSLAFTLRGNRMRLISLRPASQKERKLYNEQN
jgi:uncharacterized protein